MPQFKEKVCGFSENFCLSFFGVILWLLLSSLPSPSWKSFVLISLLFDVFWFVWFVHLEFNTSHRMYILYCCSSGKCCEYQQFLLTLTCFCGTSVELVVKLFQLFLLGFKSTFVEVWPCARISVDVHFQKFQFSMRKLCRTIASIFLLFWSSKIHMNLFFILIKNVSRVRYFQHPSYNFINSCENDKLKLFYCLLLLTSTCLLSTIENNEIFHFSPWNLYKLYM